MTAPFRCIVALLAWWVVACAPPAFAQAHPAATRAETSPSVASPALEGRALVHALRAGGYVLYMRHTSTDFGQNDEQMTDYDDCSKQRNLTDSGRAEARAIGAAVKALGIPVGQVWASPYCRTLETSRLVFGKATVSLAVRGGPAQPESADRYTALRALLSTPPPAGTNNAIASHGNPFFGVAGPPYLAEGEMAVIKPVGDGRFEVVARITKAAWSALAEAR